MFRLLLFFCDAATEKKVGLIENQEKVGCWIPAASMFAVEMTRAATPEMIYGGNSGK